MQFTFSPLPPPAVQVLPNRRPAMTHPVHPDIDLHARRSAALDRLVPPPTWHQEPWPHPPEDVLPSAWTDLEATEVPSSDWSVQQADGALSWAPGTWRPLSVEMLRDGRDGVHVGRWDGLRRRLQQSRPEAVA